MKQTPADEQQKGLDMIKAVYVDKEATVNGRTYTILTLQHHDRLKVFSYFTTVKDQMEQGNLGFMGTLEWLAIDKLISSKLSFNGDILSKIPGHFDGEAAEDYVTLMSTMMAVFSYPFLKGSLTS